MQLNRLTPLALAYRPQPAAQQGFGEWVQVGNTVVQSGQDPRMVIYLAKAVQEGHPIGLSFSNKHEIEYAAETGNDVTRKGMEDLKELTERVFMSAGETLLDYVEDDGLLFSGQKFTPEQVESLKTTGKGLLELGKNLYLASINHTQAWTEAAKLLLQDKHRWIEEYLNSKFSS